MYYQILQKMNQNKGQVLNETTCRIIIISDVELRKKYHPIQEALVLSNKVLGGFNLKRV